MKYSLTFTHKTQNMISYY